jgi:hypothetical protein
MRGRKISVVAPSPAAAATTTTLARGLGAIPRPRGIDLGLSHIRSLVIALRLVGSLHVLGRRVRSMRLPAFGFALAPAATAATAAFATLRAFAIRGRTLLALVANGTIGLDRLVGILLRIDPCRGGGLAGLRIEA